MKNGLWIIALCLVAACGSTGSSGGSGSSGSSPSSAPAAQSTAVPAQSLAVSPQASAPQDVTFAGMLNGARAATGASSVSFDARLGRAAQGHANDMLRNGYFSHTGLDGSSAGDRIRAEGYTPRTWGENIAKGQRSEEEVFEGWQNSPGHRRNNLNPNFEDFALAKAGSGSQTHWVLVFASER